MADRANLPSQYPSVPEAIRLTHIDFENPAIDLQIDAFIQKMRTPDPRAIGLSDRWKCRDAVALGRRALEVSVYSADFAIEERAKSVWKGEWEQGSSLANEAYSAIRKLNKFLANSHPTGKEPTPLSIAFPIRTMTSRMMPERSIAERHLWAKSTGDTLWEAEVRLKSIAAQMGTYHSDLAATLKNVGAPEKTAFVKVWAEAWIVLTERIPGKGLERNPFLTLVEKAWEDVQGPRDNNFSQALKNWHQSNRPSIGDPHGFIPSWMT